MTNKKSKKEGHANSSNNNEKSGDPNPNTKKGTDPLSYGGFLFKFPLSVVLPKMVGGLDGTQMKGLRESIERRGVRVPIAVKTPPDFHILDGGIASTDGSTQDDNTSAIELQRTSNGNDTTYEASLPDGDNQEGALLDAKSLPTVQVISGELRLRIAAYHSLPIEEVPFREYDPVPPEMDEEFKDLLRSDEDRARYDQFSKPMKEVLRAAHDLWEIDGWRRGGRNTAARKQKVMIIDNLMSSLGFEQISTRDMAEVVGCSHTTVRRDREDVVTEDDEQMKGLAGEMERLTSKRSDIRHGVELIRGILQMNDFVRKEDCELESTDVTSFDLVVKVVQDHLTEKIQDLKDSFNQRKEKHYGGAPGTVSDFFEQFQPTEELQDKLLAQEETDFTSDKDYSDQFGSGETEDSGTSVPDDPTQQKEGDTASKPKSDHTSDSEDASGIEPTANLATPTGRK